MYYYILKLILLYYIHTYVHTYIRTYIVARIARVELANNILYIYTHRDEALRMLHFIRPPSHLRAAAILDSFFSTAAPAWPWLQPDGGGGDNDDEPLNSCGERWVVKDFICPGCTFSFNLINRINES